MAKINFPSTTSPGVRRAESAGRLINAYVEPLGSGAREGFVTRRAPGSRIFNTGPGGVLPYRGAMFIPGDDLLYAAYLGELYTFNSAGASLAIGTVAGSAPVTFARNNRTPTPDRVVVTGDGQVYTFTTAAVTPLVDADLPAPNSVCFLDGYFFFTIPDGRCFASGINATTIDANHYTRAEAYADGLLRGIVRDRDLLLFGRMSCEVFSNTANPTGFPFSRTTVFARGLLNAWAVAGWEPSFTDGLIFVGDDCLVYALNGYRPEKISTPELDTLISNLTPAEKLLVRAFSYMTNGHSLVTISGPGFSWSFDISTGQWHERLSFLGALQTSDWRVRGNMVSAFGQWIGGDAYTNDLWSVDADEQQEGTDALLFWIESAPMAQFPAKIRIPRARFAFTAGQGSVIGSDPTETNPRVEISWSDDGGNRWSMPLLREIGRQGEYGLSALVNRCGRTGPIGRIWRLRSSDPRYIGFLSGDMEAAL